MKDTETFIDKTNNVKNIEKVNIPKADNDQEAKDDPRIVLESVQKTVHVVARFAGCGVSPPHHLLRVTWRQFQFLHQAVSLKVQVSVCPNLHQHGIFCTDL